MASALLAIVVGLAAVANYTLFSVVPTGLPQVLSVIGQGVLSVFAIIVFVTFQGRKTWRKRLDGPTWDYLGRVDWYAGVIRSDVTSGAWYHYGADLTKIS
ncbi:hypothetical protein [Weissella cibaria]|uniref:hypothetical protein n=1 Tax=Weissella cibaria TaxID=137591 RepID=UPI001F5BAA61|nr:hypothetical protein [Weissella cibaria]